MKVPLIFLALVVSVGSAPSTQVTRIPTTRPAHRAADKQQYDHVIRAQTVEIDLASASGHADTLVELSYRLETSLQWTTLPPAPARQPIRVRFDREGVYQVRLKSRHMTATTSPTTPEKTCRWLVDWTVPIVDIISTNYIPGRLLVNWLAFDQHFPTQPVQLYFVNEKGQTLLTRSTNSGWADIALDESLLPGRLKLTARDLAGHAAHTWSKPIPPNAVLPGHRRTKALLVTRTPKPTSQPASPTVTRKPSPAATAPAAPRTRTPEATEARRQYNIATAYRLSGRRGLAVEHYRRAIALSPKLLAPYVDLAGVLSATGHYNEAEKYYTKALDLDDRSVEGWQGLGLVYVRLGNVAQAKTCFEKLTAIDRRHIQGWMYLGDAWWMLGERDQALKSWQVARDIARKRQLTALVQAAEQRCKLTEQR